MENSELSYIQKGRKSIILCANGYKYYRIREYKDGSSIWRCSAKSSGKFNCVGSLTVKNEVIKKFKEHNANCKSNTAQVELEKEIATCKSKLATTDSHKSVPEVYNESVISIMDKGYDKVCKVPTFTSIKSSLYNARNIGEGMPKFCYVTPAEVIVPPKYSSFLLGDFNYDGERILMFCTQENRHNVEKIKHIFIDGTFKACPFPFKQIYTIHFDAFSNETENNIVPFIYALMTGMSERSYINLFQIIKSQLPGFAPNKCTSDYEEAARAAIASIFPNIDVKGCYYHYSNSVWRKAKILKLTKPGYIKKIIALTSVLPLLPSQHILEGWEYILNKISFLKLHVENITELNEFVVYFKNVWLKSSDFIRSWCIFGERHRTNNNVEGWHLKLNNAIKRKQVNLIQLLKVLHDDAKLTTFKRGKIERQQLLKKRKREYVINDKIILDMQMQLVNGELSVPLFLESLRS